TFVACCVISTAINGIADPKETLLFAISLAAYPAGRLYPSGSVGPSFIWTTATVVVVGSIITLIALFRWYDPNGKPLVFGEFGAAPPQFTISLALLLFALASVRLTTRQVLGVAALIIAPVGVFAAAMVRFAFVAMTLALGIGGIVAAPQTVRRNVAILIVTLAAAVVGGLLMRSTTTARFVGLEIDALKPLPTLTSCAADDFGKNTITIRRHLFREAIGLLPTAGLFGIGLDRFMEHSCMTEQHEVHISLLQAFVEFGWLGGAALALLVILSGWSLLKSSESETTPETRFALCGLMFSLMMTMAHGRLSRDGMLFLFLGYAAGIGARGWFGRA
ncbi:hypothetical protein, partial [Bradyrhizobium sp.]|uniref:hypothetical protein n=1 Tax=Bradyrhizobium sp. TaxID=376 RepID=UPI002391DBCF